MTIQSSKTRILGIAIELHWNLHNVIQHGDNRSHVIFYIGFEHFVTCIIFRIYRTFQIQLIQKFEMNWILFKWHCSMKEIFKLKLRQCICVSVRPGSRGRTFNLSMIDILAGNCCTTFGFRILDYSPGRARGGNVVALRKKRTGSFLNSAEV